MKEEVLHVFWDPKYLGRNHFKLVANQTLEIHNFGFLNLLQGPDFVDFRGEISGQLMAGFMEMHWLSSDWLKHRHSEDTKYDNVVLHVVWEDDLKLNPIRNKEGQILPTLELSRYFSRKDLQKSQMKVTVNVYCEAEVRLKREKFQAEYLRELEMQKLISLKKKLEFQQQKFKEILKFTTSDWESAAWIWLGSYWVDPQNRISAERVFRSIPLKKLKRGNWQEVLVEIMYRFGLFEASPDLPIFKQIIPLVQDKLSFLEEHFNNKREILHWYHGKVRYHNYPLVRIIQYLSFVAAMEGNLSELMKDESAWKNLEMSQQTMDYKFGFSKLAVEQIHRIAANAWLPIYLTYLEHRGIEFDDHKLLDLFQNWKPEVNRVVKKFRFIDKLPVSAYDSFSHISLWQNWCSAKYCSNCRVGKFLWNV